MEELVELGNPSADDTLELLGFEWFQLVVVGGDGEGACCAGLGG